jgi:hypothetical protein
MSTDSVVHIAFAGVVGLASVWNMWGGDMFPAEKDPTGGKLPLTPIITQVHSAFPKSLGRSPQATDPETWTESELRRWLRAVSELSYNSS